MTACPDSKTRIDRIQSLRRDSAELTQNFRLFREATFIFFREDELPVELDVENATSAGNELGRDVVVLLDLGCQTGGLRFVVSTRAVGNSDDHSFLPRRIILESTTSALVDALGRPLFHESEHVTRDPAHLDFFRALRDAIAAVVAIDVFEGLVT